MSRFIVTGAAGLIGSHVVKSLNTRGETDILAVDHLHHPGQRANLAQLETGAYLDRDAFRSALNEGNMKPVDAVFHLGACSSTTETNIAYLQDNNVAYTKMLGEWCLENDIRFIYASSAATYGDGSRGYSDAHDQIPTLQPLNPYGHSKQDVDLWALETGKLNRIVGLKYFNVFGPGEDHKGGMRSVIHKAFIQIMKTGRFGLFKSTHSRYRDGEQLRDFVDVRDAAAVTLWFYDHPQANGIFNCGTGRARSWLDLLKAVFTAMGREPAIDFIDMPDTLKDKYQNYTCADLSKLRAAGCDHPFNSLENAVTFYVKHYLTPNADNILS